MKLRNTWSRREIMAMAAAVTASPAGILAQEESMLKREIPSSGEALPVIGLGTYNVFDVSGTPEEIEVRQAIVELLIDHGGNVIDSSPMYNRAEEVVGKIVAAGGARDKLFLASKVWTDGKASGEAQMQRSIDLMRADTMDLMQVHNLRDLGAHLETIREWQDAGRIRYNGVTDYRASALDEIEAVMDEHRPQFIQINYSLGEREADRRVLPLAEELGIAVLINRPYMTGRLFRAIGDRPLPDWATEFAESWGQFFLKYIVSYTAVTCVIPATSKLHHMSDNLRAGFGPMPDQRIRRRMEQFMDAL